MIVWAQIRKDVYGWKVRNIANNPSMQDNSPIGNDWWDIDDFYPLPEAGDYINPVTRMVIAKPELVHPEITLKYLVPQDVQNLKTTLYGRALLELFHQLKGLIE